MQGKWLRRILKISGWLLSTSALLDSTLWVLTGYYVPCWTIAAMSIGCAALIFCMARMIK